MGSEQGGVRGRGTVCTVCFGEACIERCAQTSPLAASQAKDSSLAAGAGGWPAVPCSLNPRAINRNAVRTCAASIMRCAGASGTGVPLASRNPGSSL